MSWIGNNSYFWSVNKPKHLSQMKTYITELERNGSRVCFATEPQMNVQAESMVAAARAASEHDAAMYADTVVVLIHHGSTGDTERIPFRILAKGRVSID